MKTTILNALIDEKQLMSYCMKVTDREKKEVEETLARCIYWNCLSALSPIIQKEELLIAGKILAQGTLEEQQDWLKKQPSTLLTVLSERIDRTFLSLERTL